MDKIVDYDQTINDTRYSVTKQSNLDNKKQVFCCFCSLFWIYYYPWIRAKPEQLLCREEYFMKRLINILNVSTGDQTNLIDMSQDMAKKFRKLLKIKLISFFNVNAEQEKINLEIVCNNQVLSVDLYFKQNMEIFYEVDQVSYENNESIVIKTVDNEVFVQIYPSDIGFTEIDERFVSNDSSIIFNLSFDWIVDENSCKSMVTKPRPIAYYFSAVLLELGSRYWKMFRVMHKVLADSSDQSVRRLIIASLHELSVILKKSDTLCDLIPMFARFLETEQNILIETSFLQNIVIFFDHLDHYNQIRCIQLLPPFNESDHQIQSKLKILTANKICNLLNKLSENEVTEYVASLAIEMLKTEHNGVVKSGNELFCATVQQLSKLETSDDTTATSYLLSDVLTRLVHQLADSECVRLHTSFVNVCDKLVLDSVVSQVVFDQYLDTQCKRIINRNQNLSSDMS